MKLSPESHSVRIPRGSFVGLTTVDVVFAFEEYPVEDTKNTAHQYVTSAGGPASNAAVVFSYLGGEAQLISSLGKSSIADIARRDLLCHGVRHFDITPTRAMEPALSAIAIAESNGSRTIFTSPAIDDEADVHLPEEELFRYVGGIDILLLDGHQSKLAGNLAQLAKERGVVVVLDGDLHGPHTEDLLPLVDIAIFGKSFAVPGKASGRETFEYFESFGIKQVIATNGHNPIELRSNYVSDLLEVEKVPVVDTLAAGDFFHGAFCYSFSMDRDIKRAMEFAAKVASSSITEFGTRKWMNEREPSSFE